MEPVGDITSPLLPCTFCFTKFIDLFKYADQDTSVTIKALVIHAFPLKMLRQNPAARDYILVDETKMPMIMRAWKNPQHDDGIDLGRTLPKPMLVVATNLKVTTFNGISLASKYTTAFLEDPPLAEDYPLKEWYKLHIQEIKELLEATCYRDPTRLLLPPNADQILTISAAVDAIDTRMQARTPWVAVKVKLVPAQEKFWYTACSHCNKALDAEYGRTLYCSACQEQTIIQLRAHLEVYLTDETSTICATMYSADAEKLMGNTVVTLQLLQNEGQQIECKIEEAIENKHVICFIKCHDKFVKGTLLRKYPIVKMYPSGEIFTPTVHDNIDKGAVGMLTPTKAKDKQLL